MIFELWIYVGCLRFYVLMIFKMLEGWDYFINDGFLYDMINCIWKKVWFNILKINMFLCLIIL